MPNKEDIDTPNTINEFVEEINKNKLNNKIIFIKINSIIITFY